MKDWKKYQIVFFIASVIFFIGFILDLSHIVSFNEFFGRICLLLFTLSTSIYLFEREKVASLLFIISTILILINILKCLILVLNCISHPI